MKVNFLYILSVGLVGTVGFGAANFATSLQNTTQAQTFKSENNLVENGITDLSNSLQKSQLYVDKLTDSNKKVSDTIPELSEKLDETRKNLIYSDKYYSLARDYMLKDAVYNYNYEKVATLKYPVLYSGTDIPLNEDPSNPIDKDWVSDLFKKPYYIPVTYQKTYTKDQKYGIKTINWNDFGFASNNANLKIFSKVLVTPNQFDQLITEAANEILKDDSIEAKQFIREYFIPQYSFKFKTRFNDLFGLNGAWISSKKTSSLWKAYSNFRKSRYVKPQTNYHSWSDPNVTYDENLMSDNLFHMGNLANWYFPDSNLDKNYTERNISDFSFAFYKRAGLKTELYPLIKHPYGYNYLNLSYNNVAPFILDWTRRFNDSKYASTNSTWFINEMFSFNNSMNFFNFNNNPLRESHYHLSDTINSEENIFASDSKNKDWVGTFYLAKQNTQSNPSWHINSHGFHITKGSNVNRNNYTTILKKEAEFANDYTTIKVKEYNLAIWINPDNGALIVTYILDNGQTVPNLEIADFQIMFESKSDSLTLIQGEDKNQSASYTVVTGENNL